MSAIALSNLSWWASDVDIESACRTADDTPPSITTLRIATDPLSGKSLGRAVVHFATAALAATVQAHLTSANPIPLPGTDIQCTVLPSATPAAVAAFLDEPVHPRVAAAAAAAAANAAKAAPQRFQRHPVPPYSGAPPGAPAFPPGMPRLFPPGMMPPPPAFMGGMPPGGAMPPMPPFMWMPPPAQPQKHPTAQPPGSQPRSPPAGPAPPAATSRSLSPRVAAPAILKPPTPSQGSPHAAPALHAEASREPSIDRDLRRSASRSASPSTARGGSRGHHERDRIRDRHDTRDRHRERDRERDYDRDRELDRERLSPGMRRDDPRRPNGLSREELNRRRARWSRESADRDRDRVLRPGRSDRRGEHRAYEDNIGHDGHELRIPQEVKERLLERKENAERRSRRRAAMRDRSPSLSPPPPDYRNRSDKGSPPHTGYRRPRSRSRSGSRSPSLSPDRHDDRRATKRRRHSDYGQDERERDRGRRDDPELEAIEEDEDFRDRDEDVEKGGSGRRERRRRGGKYRKRSGRSSLAVSPPGQSGQRSGSRGEHRGSSGRRSRTSRR